MTFNDLLSACDRLRSDPRVEGNTPVELETEIEEEDGIFEPTITTAVSLAVNNSNGHRAIVLSSLLRDDALVR